MKGIILHGGKGTRLRPLTHTGPKQLIPIANKPISQYCLEALREVGITDIGIVLGDIFPEKVREFYGDGSRFGVSIRYIDQGAPRGIAQAIGLTKDFVGQDRFVVYLGDNLLRNRISALVEEFRKNGADCQIALSRVKDPGAFGVAEVRGGRVIRLVEKPQQPFSDLALVGVYMFTPVIFEAISQLTPSWRGELEITEAIQKLIDWGLRLEAMIVDGWWKDTGKPEDILEANQLVLADMKGSVDGVIEEGVIVEGQVQLGNGSVVRAGCHIRGPAIIGNSCNIGPDTYIGPYTSIGDGVRMVGGEIENSIVIGNAYIDCGRRIIDSIIGEGTRIVASSRLPKGVRLIIGENSQLAL